MRQLIKEAFIWILINLLLNFLGVGIIKIIHEDGIHYQFIDFLPHIAIQSTLFTITYLISYYTIKNKKISLYSFVFIQVIIFHGILLNNLVKDERGLRVYTNFKEDIIYLMYNSQGMIDIISAHYPLYGDYDHGLFIPDSTTWFYILWIILPLIYYYLITYLTDRIIKRQPTLNTDGNPGTNAQTSA